jgi:SAM-dependent methyltransferase
MTEAPYVLGTHDEEVARLGLQHGVWRSRVLETWKAAGFTAGHTILDLGCGPGYASLDLAEIVGPTGRVIAIDRSRRFLDVLDNAARDRGITHIETIEGDLDTLALPARPVDGVWCRWAAAFVRRPRQLLERVATILTPGGTFAAHEYFDYGTWRFVPPLAEMDEFVNLVIASWRESGGEPNIGLDMPEWLDALDFDVTRARPIVELIDPQHALWPWPRAFIASGLRRLVDLGLLTSARAREIQQACDAREGSAHPRMITPAVLEIVARRASTSRR